MEQVYKVPVLNQDREVYEVPDLNQTAEVTRTKLDTINKQTGARQTLLMYVT